MTKPVFLELLANVTVVPTLIQKALLDLASGMLGVAVALEPPLRLMLMEQGEEVEPHVLAAAQILARLEAEQTSPLIFFGVSLPTMRLVNRSGRTNRQQRAAK
jgi:hypothetical protein